jgi:hypothetical protein
LTVPIIYARYQDGRMDDTQEKETGAQ